MQSMTLRSPRRLIRVGVVAPCTAGLLVSGSYGGEPTIGFTMVVDHTTAVRGLVTDPALHNGQIVFGGVTGNVYPFQYVLAVRSADGTGPFTILADESTPMPNVPGETFCCFADQAIYDGTVVFRGTQDATTPPPSNYVVQSTGGPIQPLPNTPMRWLTAGEAGVAGRVTTGGTGSLVFIPWGQQPISLVQGDPPGGGSFGGAVPSPATGPAIGADTIVFASFMYGLPEDYAVFTYDIPSGAHNLVANGNTPMPGQSGPAPDVFDFMSHCDTDGQNVVFYGKHGSIGFGGVAGVFVAPVGASGNGPFDTVAISGDPMPDSSEVFYNFGRVLIQGNLVLFEGRNEINTLHGLYGSVLSEDGPGPPFKVVATGDVIDGRVITYRETHPRGLDGNQVVFRITYDGPCNPLAFCTAYYVATIETPSSVVPGDITGDGVVNVNDLLSVIGAWGPCPQLPDACPADIAPVAGDGAVNVADLLMVIGNWG